MEVLNPEVLIPLREWVTSRGVPESAAHALTMHEFTLTDLLEHAQREDISRLNLKSVHYLFWIWLMWYFAWSV